MKSQLIEFWALLSDIEQKARAKVRAVVYGTMLALVVEMEKAGLLPGKKSVIVVTDPPSEITSSGGVTLPIGGVA